MRFERLFWVIFWRAKVKLWGSVSMSVRGLRDMESWVGRGGGIPVQAKRQVG